MRLTLSPEAKPIRTLFHSKHIGQEMGMLPKENDLSKNRFSSASRAYEKTRKTRFAKDAQTIEKIYVYIHRIVLDLETKKPFHIEKNPCLHATAKAQKGLPQNPRRVRGAFYFFMDE